MSPRGLRRCQVPACTTACRWQHAAAARPPAHPKTPPCPPARSAFPSEWRPHPCCCSPPAMSTWAAAPVAAARGGAPAPHAGCRHARTAAGQAQRGQATANSAASTARLELVWLVAALNQAQLQELTQGAGGGQKRASLRCHRGAAHSSATRTSTSSNGRAQQRHQQRDPTAGPAARTTKTKKQRAWVGTPIDSAAALMTSLLTSASSPNRLRAPLDSSSEKLRRQEGQGAWRCGWVDAGAAGILQPQGATGGGRRALHHALRAA